MPGASARAGRYSSAPNMAARFAAQTALMKPYLHALVTPHVLGKEHLKGVQRPYLVVANHCGDLDAALIFDSLPSRLSRGLATGVAADRFFTTWWKAAPTALFFNAFPIERPGKELKKNPGSRRGMAGKLLAKGVPILIFPEGTRSRTGAMGAFNPGAAALSISRDATVIPAAIVGSFAALPSGGKPAPGRPDVYVTFGRPEVPTPDEIATEFSERLRRIIVGLHDTTARAYGMPTQADLARAARLREITRGPRREAPTTEGEQ